MWKALGGLGSLIGWAADWGRGARSLPPTMLVLWDLMLARWDVLATAKLFQLLVHLDFPRSFSLLSGSVYSQLGRTWREGPARSEH